MADFDKKKIESLLKNPTVTDDKLSKFLRESAREKIANKLIWLIGILYIVFLISGSLLVYTSKIQFRDLLDLIDEKIGTPDWDRKKLIRYPNKGDDL